jgi:hypothetical protein
VEKAWREWLELSADLAEHEVVLVAAWATCRRAPLPTLPGCPSRFFIAKLADYGMPVFKLSDDDIARDARNARSAEAMLRAG